MPAGGEAPACSQVCRVPNVTLVGRVLSRWEDRTVIFCWRLVCTFNVCNCIRVGGFSSAQRVLLEKKDDGGGYGTGFTQEDLLLAQALTLKSHEICRCGGDTARDSHILLYEPKQRGKGCFASFKFCLSPRLWMFHRLRLPGGGVAGDGGHRGGVWIWWCFFSAPPISPLLVPIILFLWALIPRPFTSDSHLFNHAVLLPLNVKDDTSSNL